ncbi:MAG: hypothetical protein ACE5Z5_12850 [Candidatus Bathyarchaeia archaeon]
MVLSPESQIQELTAKRSRLLSELFKLDQTYQQKKIGQKEYQRSREGLEREIWETEQELLFSSIQPEKRSLEDQQRIEFKKQHIQNLLARFISNHIDTLIPIYNPTLPTGHSYPEAERAMSLPPIETVNQLRKLEDLEILTPHFHQRIFFCPNCESPHLRLRIACPNCNSEELFKGSVIEHFSCGHVDFQEDYKRGERLICPKCNGALRLIGVDYRRIESSYKCNNCATLMENPQTNLQCQRCKHVFAINEAIGRDIYTYSLNPQARNEAQRSMMPLHSLRRPLEAMGYRVVAPAVKVGRSGVEHRFDLLATKTSNGGGLTFALEASLSDQPIKSEEVLRVYAKTIDAEIDNMHILAIPRLSEEARSASRAYGINYVEAESPSEAVEKVVRKLSASGQAQGNEGTPKISFKPLNV